MDEANNVIDHSADDLVKLFGDKITTIKCPLTGKLIDKSKVRKVYFF